MIIFQQSHNLKGIINITKHLRPYIQIQNRNLVNVKLKWVKDTVLDSAVSSCLHLKATCTLISLIGSQPHSSLPIYILNRCRNQLDLPSDLKLSTFIRRYPNIFKEFNRFDSKGTPVPWYQLSSEAFDLYNQEMCLLYEDCHVDILNRLQKFLMLTKHRFLPLQTIDQLRWDLGLPYDYKNTFIAKHPELFSFVQLSSELSGLQLLVCDSNLAVSYLEQKNSDIVQRNEPIAFPIRFTRGFGLKKKCMEWLNEWQKLPYTSPYLDETHLDPRLDVSEKRIVGIFHELLHLTVMKRTERKNVSNLRKPFTMPQKFTKVFERHPGIFYISKKGDTQTVVLREAYDRGQLIEKHPLSNIWEQYAVMMKQGFLDRSRGLYLEEHRRTLGDDLGKKCLGGREHDCALKSEAEDCDYFSEYE